MNLSSIMEILGEGELSVNDFPISIPPETLQSAADKVREAEEETAKTLKQEMDHLLQKEKEELRKSNATHLESTDDTAPSEQDLQTIEKLLAKLQKDRAIWEQIFSLGKDCNRRKS